MWWQQMHISIKTGQQIGIFIIFVVSGLDSMPVKLDYYDNEISDSSVLNEGIWQLYLVGRDWSIQVGGRVPKWSAVVADIDIALDEL